MADDTLRVLGDRYEIHQRLARGGMAQVYLARDRSLDRPVAVKELAPEFAVDQTFVERFRREAQAAANLSHPNIVGVYDWGTQDGTYFIVMEYIEGPSLSQVIRHDGPLHPRRAAEIASEVAAALGFAHSRGLVHRDVKPGNVLLTGTGQSKVTDFGIARALSSGDDELTQAGSVMGTATYFSPEQAQGLPVDPRSDLYSLGVVLFEMITGRPPFSGETPLAISYKHVQDRPPLPTSIVSDIPPALEAVVMKLLRKRPDDRYASAEEVRADLRRFANGEHTIAERELVGAAAAAAAAAGADATRVQGAAVPLPPPEDALTEPEEERSRTGLWLGLVVLLVLLLAGGLFLLANTLGGTDQVAVPPTKGMTQVEAEKALAAVDLKTTVEERADDAVEVGRVITSDPDANTEVDTESTVKLVVSTGPVQIAVPPVTNLPLAEAEKALTDAGLAPRAATVENDDVAPGTVVAQNPAPGAQVTKGSPVDLAVAKASGQELVPDVSGQTLAAAQAALQDAGFRVSTKEQPSNTVERGRVIGTDPAAGTSLKKNAVVTIIVSSGKEQVRVPSVTGQTEAEATETLRGSGFEVEVATQDLPANDSKDGRVLAQDPRANSTVDAGTTVRIAVGRAAAATTTSTTSTTTSAP